MGLTLAQKLIKAHLVEGEMIPGTEIGLRIDQTLTQDATGTMAYLEFEAMGVDRVKTEKALPILTTTLYRRALKMQTITATFKPLPKSTAFIFQDPATAYATRFILKDSAFPEKR